MTLYNSKPTQVEAVQWTGDNLVEIEAFGVKFQYSAEWHDPLHIEAGMDGAQGWVPVPLGHFIVRSPGVLNDHWPVDPKYFREKYEPA